MRLLRTLGFILFAVPCALAAPQNSPVSSPAVLPRVTAYALDRAKVTLPTDFASPLNLLILSFQRDQQSVVDGWLPQLTAERRSQRATLAAAGLCAGKRPVPLVVERLVTQQPAGIAAASLYGSLVCEQGAISAILTGQLGAGGCTPAHRQDGARAMARYGTGDRCKAGRAHQFPEIGIALSLGYAGGNHVHCAMGRKRCTLLPTDDMAGVVPGHEDAALRLDPYLVALGRGVVVRH